MRKINKSAFTLVELLVVITILAIISVVAYQNFWGATDKAISSRKINDVSTIESALLQYKVNNNFYPAVLEYDDDNNKWWYNSWSTAYPSNTITVSYDWNKITWLTSWSWWWIVYGSWSLWQIWAKWTIWRDNLTRQYLSNDLYDPELWDINVWNDKMIDFWIGRYVYGVYRRSANWWTQNLPWSYFNIAYTIKDSNWEDYITKIVWDYDETVCSESIDCPKTLIWTMTWTNLSWDNRFLIDWTKFTLSPTTNENQWIPYPVTDFTLSNP